MKRSWGVLARALAVAGLIVGGVVTVASPAGAYPPSCRETFPSGTPSPLMAPPNATVTGDQVVSVTGQVADIDVTVWAGAVGSADFSFGAADDFAGHSAELTSLGGGSTLDGVTFDDEAVGEMSGLPPTTYSGHYRPLTALSALDGLQTARSWELKVVNTDTSTLYVNWTITITYAGCAPDQDGDGVPDASDSCAGTAARTASGCPLATTSLTAKYRLGKFKGALTSSSQQCSAAQGVTVWKVRKGPDLKVGARTTASDGRFKIKRAKKPGRYYATSPRSVVPGIAECPAARSTTFRVR
jgi:hypothetical protein